MTERHWIHDIAAPGVTPDVRDGIWALHPPDADQFFAEYLSEPALAVLAQADRLGWKQAVEQSLPHLVPWIADYTRDYFLETYRSDFVETLGLGPGSTVLDAGCGWGFSAHRCLEKGARVVGSEMARRRLEFCRTRFAQEGFGDRFVGIQLDANRPFPFADGTFDAVIASGLVEWLPSTTTGAPEAVQQRFIDRAHALLKPGGRLYVAIENRYWWKYFLGVRDLHRIHRLQVLTSILPRRLARMWSILVTGQDYRTYCHSVPTYAGMFHKAGFATLDVSHPQPDYVQPKTVRRLGSGLPLGEGTGGLLRALAAQKASFPRVAFARSFMFVATRRG